MWLRQTGLAHGIKGSALAHRKTATATKHGHHEANGKAKQKQWQNPAGSEFN